MQGRTGIQCDGGGLGMADLSVRIAGVDFKNPVIPASGCFGYGEEYEEFYPLSLLGGISIKGTTRLPRIGNPTPRIAECPSGMLNSVGLQNPGIEHFISSTLPVLLTKDTVIIANIAGSTSEECAEMAEMLDETGVHMLELNISCPNVKKGGAAFGTHCDTAAQVTAAVRAKTKKPLIVKLTPNVTSVSEIALAVESAGADCISLINTILGMRIDIKTGRPVLRNNTGGLSGAAVLPIAVRMVYEVFRAVKIPIIGMGGINTAHDAIEIMMAGAAAVQVGAAMFTDPFAPVKIIDGLAEYMDENGISSLSEIIGAVKPW